MKGLLSSLGWILLLVLAVVFLLFYNIGYVPKLDRVFRQQREIDMWTNQVQELSDSLKAVTARADTAFLAVLTFDQLFGGADNFQLVSSAESTLKGMVPSLNAGTGAIQVVGHTDNGPVPAKLREQYPTNWEYGAARAGAVARTLTAWGVAANRVSVQSFGDKQPAGSNATAAGRASNRRVEIVVLTR
jgi:flagellar motor protein MotB